MKDYSKLDMLGLTEEQFKLFTRSCHSTLGAIFSDAWGDKTAPRSHVIEVVLDADYMRMYGVGGKEWIELYDTVINPWISKHYSTPKFKKLMKEVFPFSRYSL
jgi:hypothetical protein